MLELIGLAVTLPDGTRLFGPLDLQVAPGQIAAIMGPSGIGKSTLLDAIGGHLGQGFGVMGAVRLNGCDLTGLAPEARRIGLVAQDPALFPHLSVGQNLAFAVPPQRGRTALIAQALARAGLEGFAPRDPATLSGGQRARVSLLRSLLARPAALLLDEPFARLDTALRSDIRAFTFAHVRASGIPALLVTHDPEDGEFADFLFDLKR